MSATSESGYRRPRCRRSSAMRKPRAEPRREIIKSLDQGLVDVDVLEARFRRAIEIVEELDQRIRGAKERVEALLPRLDAIGSQPRRGHSG